MYAWIIYESDSPTVDKSYETKLLEREAFCSPHVRHVETHNISKLDVLNLSSGDCLTVNGTPLRELPDFAITRSVTLKDCPQWLPVLRHLKKKGVLCINDAQSIEVTADKFQMWEQLTRAGIPTPHSQLLDTTIDVDLVSQRFGWPVVLKQIHGTQGIGVALCNTPEELLRTAQIFKDNAPHIPLKIQKFVATSKGRDVRAFVVGDEVIAAMLRQSGSSSEFRSNYTLGGSVNPFDLPKEGQKIAIGAAKALGLKYSGVDLLFGKAGFEVCEANKAPGFKGLEQAHPGMNVARIILEHSIILAQAHIASSRQQKHQGLTPSLTIATSELGS